MSRTTRCLFVLGLSVSLAAACGDDDDVTPSGGGSGGRAGSAGTGGRAGSAGTGGAAGTAGVAGTAGTGGTTAGTGGSSAGTGGSSAGTGGSVAEPVDAGADAATDAAVATDAGPIEIVECPADLEEESAGAFTSTGTQEVIITRVVFVGGGAEVTFRALEGGFNFTPPLELCTGSEFGEDCDPGVQDVTGSGAVDGGVGDLLPGEEVTYTTPGVNPVAGELALINGAVGDSIVRAYIAWGNFTSLPPSVGDFDDLETRAVAENVWTDGERVELLGNTTVYATDDVTGADGFEVCTDE